MKGVILTGGLGTRLCPLTKVTNKHWLTLQDRCMGDYGVALFDGSDPTRPIAIEEKSKQPRSYYPVTGFYI